MRILKHTQNGRLFVETPALLANRYLEVAPKHEADAYIEEMRRAGQSIPRPAETFVSPAAASARIDPDTDLTFLGKGELTVLAGRLGVPVPMRSNVNDIRSRVQNALDDLKAGAAVESQDGTEEDA